LPIVHGADGHAVNNDVASVDLVIARIDHRAGIDRFIETNGHGQTVQTGG